MFNRRSRGSAHEHPIAERTASSEATTCLTGAAAAAPTNIPSPNEPHRSRPKPPRKLATKTHANSSTDRARHRLLRIDRHDPRSRPQITLLRTRFFGCQDRPTRADFDFERELVADPSQRSVSRAITKQMRKVIFIAENPRAIVAGGASGAAVVPGMPGESLLMALAAPSRRADHAAGGRMKRGRFRLRQTNLLCYSSGSSRGPRAKYQRLPRRFNGRRSHPRSILFTPHPIRAMPGTWRRVAPIRSGFTISRSIAMRVGLSTVLWPMSPEASTDGIAHLDLVQSIAFENNNRWIASGGYRTVKALAADATRTDRHRTTIVVKSKRRLFLATTSMLSVAMGDCNVFVMDSIRIWRRKATFHTWPPIRMRVCLRSWSTSIRFAHSARTGTSYASIGWSLELP